jgi:hypothetical protein
MFQAFGYPKQCLVLTDNGVDEAVPANTSTLCTEESWLFCYPSRHDPELKRRFNVKIFACLRARSRFVVRRRNDAE